MARGVALQLLPSRVMRTEITMRSKEIASAVLTLVIAAVGCALDPAEQADRPDLGQEELTSPVAPYQLQVMTFNTAFMRVDFELHTPPTPPYVNSIYQKIEPFESMFNMPYTQRAQIIADNIVRADPDVVALNEVFSDEARGELIDTLEAAGYKHFVSRLSAAPPGDNYTAILIDWISVKLPLIGQINFVDPLDSGLMIFSKFEFLPLGAGVRNDADCASEHCAVEGWNDGGFLQVGDVAFSRYDDCGGLDCAASKGVGLVKLATPGLPTYVLFTHMQADEEGDFTAERRAQYDQIADLINTTIPAGDLGSKPIYLMGDLNTPAARPNEPPSAEWQDIYGQTSTYSQLRFACGNGTSSNLCFPHSARLVTDAWGFETSPIDFGLTTGASRLDYIVHNNPDRALCMQRIRIPWDATSGGESYSDHLPVLGDFNMGARWCSPNKTPPNSTWARKPVAFGKFDCEQPTSTNPYPPNPCKQDVSFNATTGARITHPGSFQWFLIQQPGTYSIKTSDAHTASDVKFEVYQGADLSRPLLADNEADPSRRGFKFAMYEPPYYVRTFLTTSGKPNRTLGNIDYTIQLHQHLCRSAADACLLPPAVPVTHPWPNQTSSPFPKVKELYYQFATSPVRDGQLTPIKSAPNDPAILAPKVSFFMEPEAVCFDYAKYRIEEWDDPVTPYNLVATYPLTSQVTNDENRNFVWDERWSQPPTAPPLDSRIAGELAKYFLVVPRTCLNAMSTTTRYETDLTYFEPGEITCRKQIDDSGVGEDDHVRFDFTYDVVGESPSCEGACDAYYTFDEGWPDAMQKDGTWTPDLAQVWKLKGYYVESMYPNLFEDEGGVDDPDLRIEYRWMEDHKLFGWPDVRVIGFPAGVGMTPLHPWAREDKNQMTFGDDPIDDYHYTMDFRVNHTGPVTKCSSDSWCPGPMHCTAGQCVP